MSFWGHPHSQVFVSRPPVLAVASRREEKNKQCLGALESPLKTSAFSLNSLLPPLQPVVWCLCIQRWEIEKTITRRCPASHAPFCSYSCFPLPCSYEPKGQGCPNLSPKPDTPGQAKKEKKKRGFWRGNERRQMWFSLQAFNCELWGRFILK